MAGFGEQWAGWGVLLVALSCYISMKNLMGNAVVMISSSVVKYLLYAVAVPVAYAAEVVLGWRFVQLPIVVSILLVCTGVWMFVKDEPYAPTLRVDSEPSPLVQLVRTLSNHVSAQQMGRPMEQESKP